RPGQPVQEHDAVGARGQREGEKAQKDDEEPHEPQIGRRGALANAPAARQCGAMTRSSPRLAARALILSEDRLLVVNAYPAGVSDLWCAPGGGVHAGTSLPDNLAREVEEETGLRVAVG